MTCGVGLRVYYIDVLSHVHLFTSIPCQAPPSIEFSRQAYWSELPFPTPGTLPSPRIESTSPGRQVDSLPLGHQGSLVSMYKKIKHF